MSAIWFVLNVALVSSGALRRVPRRAQSTVEYGLTLLAVASAGLALWLLLGPAIQQLGERIVTEVNTIK